MTLRSLAEVEELRRLSAAAPAHVRFGVRSLDVTPGALPSVHEMTVGQDLLDDDDHLDLGVLALVADSSCSGVAANLCPGEVRPVTRSLRLESIRALRRHELPRTVVASAEPAWRADHDALLARAIVHTEQGEPLALATFSGVAIHVPASTPPPAAVAVEPGSVPFRIGDLTADGPTWQGQVWAGPECGNLIGHLHGGVSVLLAARVAARVHRASGPVTPLDLSVDFDRPIPAGAPIAAMARIAHSSRRFLRIEGAFHVADRVVLRFVSTAIRVGETVR